MKKSELKSIIKECLEEINEAKELGYITIIVPNNVPWDDIYDDFDTLTGMIVKGNKKIKQFHRGYKTSGGHAFSYETPNVEIATNLNKDLPNLAKKISPNMVKVIKGSKVKVM